MPRTGPGSRVGPQAPPRQGAATAPGTRASSRVPTSLAFFSCETFVDRKSPGRCFCTRFQERRQMLPSQLTQALCFGRGRDWAATRRPAGQGRRSRGGGCSGSLLKPRRRPGPRPPPRLLRRAPQATGVMLMVPKPGSPASREDPPPRSRRAGFLPSPHVADGDREFSGASFIRTLPLTT